MAAGFTGPATVGIDEPDAASTRGVDSGWANTFAGTSAPHAAGTMSVADMRRTDAKERGTSAATNACAFFVHSSNVAVVAGTICLRSRLWMRDKCESTVDQGRICSQAIWRIDFSSL